MGVKDYLWCLSSMISVAPARGMLGEYPTFYPSMTNTLLTFALLVRTAPREKQRCQGQSAPPVLEQRPSTKSDHLPRLQLECSMLAYRAKDTLGLTDHSLPREPDCQYREWVPDLCETSFILSSRLHTYLHKVPCQFTTVVQYRMHDP